MSEELISSDDVYAIIGSIHLVRRLTKSGKIKSAKRGFYYQEQIMNLKAELDERKAIEKPVWCKSAKAYQ